MNQREHLMATIHHSLSYHPPRSDKVAARHEAIRALSISHSNALVDVCDEASPELFIALDKVREAMMWANAAIACGGATGGRPDLDDTDAGADQTVNECAVTADPPPVTLDDLAELLSRIVDAAGRVPLEQAEASGLTWLRSEATALLKHR